MILLQPSAPGHGNPVYDDGVARAAELGPGLYVLEAAGRSVQFDILSIADAAGTLANIARGCRRSIAEAGRVLVDHVAESLAD